MSNTTPSSSPQSNNFLRNIVIAIVAVIFALGLFLGLQSEQSSLSLETQAQQSVPLDTALSNGKPTLMEFYANWCTSCQAIAPQMAQLKQEYGQKLNFVMLNVDNNKWLPEILKYRVDGIPHFVYLNDTGDTVAEAIGEQPLSIMTGDIEALIAHQPLPHTASQGQVSTFTAPVTPTSNRSDDPRSHGG